MEYKKEEKGYLHQIWFLIFVPTSIFHFIKGFPKDSWYAFFVFFFQLSPPISTNVTAVYDESSPTFFSNTEVFPIQKIWPLMSRLSFSIFIPIVTQFNKSFYGKT